MAAQYFLFVGLTQDSEGGGVSLYLLLAERSSETLFYIINSFHLYAPGEKFTYIEITEA